MPRHAAEDQVLPLGLRGEAHDVGPLRGKTGCELDGDRTGNGGIDRLRRHWRLRRDHFGAVREHPVVVAEGNVRLPPDRHHQCELTIAEPVEVERTVQPGEPGNQLKADRLRGRIEVQPGGVDLLLLGACRRCDRE